MAAFPLRTVREWIVDPLSIRRCPQGGLAQQWRLFRLLLAARTGLEFMRAGPVFPLLEGKRLYERRREAAKSGSKRLITLNFNVKQPILFNMPNPRPTTFEVAN